VLTQLRPLLTASAKRLRRGLFDAPGTSGDALQWFYQMTTGMTKRDFPGKPGMLIAEDVEGSVVVFRPAQWSESGKATIDLKVGGINDISKIKFDGP
jgi:hypothetical protein